MHEVVHSIFDSKLLSALRLPSFAGEGLPERMRSISFALLGLTAAAGLALVAIFAQPDFSLLSPAPLPDQPSASQSIAEAKKLPVVHRSMALLAAQPARSQRVGGSSSADAPSSGPSRARGDSGEDAPASGDIDVPAATGAPEHSSGNSGDGGSGNGSGGDSGSAPAAAPDSAAPSPPAPVSSPTPKPAAPKPEATTSTPQPEPAPAPGNSASAAAAEHASERGIEASSGSSSTAGGGATTASVAPEAASPGNGNGLAKGLNK